MTGVQAAVLCLSNRAGCDACVFIVRTCALPATVAIRHEHILSFVPVAPKPKTLSPFVVCLLLFVIIKAQIFSPFLFWAGLHKQLQKHRGLARPV